MTSKNLKIIALGDVVGRHGRNAIKMFLPELRAHFNADLVIVNAENSAGGTGIDDKCAVEIRKSGADIITLGDHVWQKSEFKPFLDKNSAWCIRPINYPEGAPGRGWTVATVNDHKVAIINAIGRTFLNLPLDCPFVTVDNLLNNQLADISIRICDLHAEATSEKAAFAHHFDGRMSLLYGTHTHVQTADQRILEQGLGFISDLGMCGPEQSVIGMDPGVATRRFMTGLKEGYRLANSKASLKGVFCEIDPASSKAVSIQRISMNAEGELEN